MRKVIVGFDATAQAVDALHLGALMATGLDAELTVASAIEFGPPDVTALGYEKARAVHYERVFDAARAELGGLEFEPRELQDTAAHGLNELAERERADLIVVGSTHHGPLGRALAGTVATALLHGAPCAVLVAPRGWSERRRSGLGLIGVGCDGSHEATAAVAVAAELAMDFDAKLRLIAVAPYIGPLGLPVQEADPPWVDVLNQGAALTRGEVATERVLRQGSAATELALQGVELDLLVVGSRSRGPLRRALLGSVAGELVRTAPCPVLVVPRGGEDPAGGEHHP